MHGRSAIIEHIFHKLTVPKCLVCRERLDKDERALCPECMKKYNVAKTHNCPVCTKLFCECYCTNDYISRHFIKKLIKLFPYKKSEEFAVVNEIIYKMKRKNRTDVFDFMADELVTAIHISLPKITEKTIITNVPNRIKTINLYGFDHAASLAEKAADKLGCEYIPLLRSLAKTPQKQLTSEERISNANFELITEVDLKGRDVIIIDDIVTTGASMGNSATMIRALSPRAIYGACIGVTHLTELIKK